MKMTRFSTLAVLGGLSISIFSAAVHADTLLVISDSQGMYGSPEMTSTMERFGAQLVVSGLEKAYRKTYQFSATDGLPLDILWQTILNERQPGEQIDVFSMEHGPNDTAIDQLSDSSKIPAGFVRRFFSTACDNWGDFSANADGSGLQLSDYNDAIHANLKLLGVQEYVIHANTNGSGLVEIPYFVREFQNGGSWLTGATRAFDQADSMLAPLISQFKGMSVGDDSSEFLDWTLLLISRPVLGGSGLQQVQTQITTRNMLPASSGEIMLAPNANLTQSLQANCPDVFSDPDKSPCTTVASTATQPQAIEAAGLMLIRLFEAYGLDEDGCVNNTAPFQMLVNGLMKRKDGLSPQIESLCVRHNDDQDVSLKLSFGPTPESAAFVAAGMNAQNARNMDFWEILVPSMLSDKTEEATISSFSLGRDVAIHLHGSNASVAIDVYGLDASIDVPDAPDALSIITHNIGLNGFTLGTGGDYTIRLAAPLLNIPVSFTDTDKDAGPTVSVLGIPFHIDN